MAASKKKAVSKKKAAKKKIVRKKTAAKSRGRPSKYDPEKTPGIAENLTLLGATVQMLAAAFDVSEETIYEWQRKHSDFSEAVTRAREPADGKVARSLFEAACGYSHEAVHISNYKGEITVTEYTKHYPPDAKALAMWLKNRQPGLWRDKPEADTGTGLVEMLKMIGEGLHGK